MAFVLLTGVAMAQELPDFDKLWNYGDPAATEVKFRELLPKATGAYRLELLTQIARTLGLRGKFAEAHAILDGVEKEMTPEMTTVRVRYLLERGRTFNSSKQQDKARPLFLEAWELGVKANHEFHAIDAAHMVAIVERGEAGLAWNEKAVAYAEKAKDPHARGWQRSLYNNIGWTYHEMGQYEKALEAHRKFWELERAKAPDSEGTRIAKWSVAKQLRMLKRVDEALAMQRELLAEFEKLGRSDGFVNEELGECLLAQGKEAEARPQFKRAYELLKEIGWVAEDKPRIERLKKLGGVE
jgi:tetratricopeptide (TPR) repeat protein